MSEKETEAPVLRPVCPFCNTTMVPRYFVGYYESFPMWECECEEIPGAKPVHGAFA